jgi:predicted transcriptional regulator
MARGGSVGKQADLVWIPHIIRTLEERAAPIGAACILCQRSREAAKSPDTVPVAQEPVSWYNAPAQLGCYTLDHSLSNPDLVTLIGYVK